MGGGTENRKINIARALQLIISEPRLYFRCAEHKSDVQEHAANATRLVSSLIEEIWGGS